MCKHSIFLYINGLHHKDLRRNQNSPDSNGVACTYAKNDFSQKMVSKESAVTLKWFYHQAQNVFSQFLNFSTSDNK